MKLLCTFVIVAVIFCSWLNVVSAQVVDIPDANLEAALRDLFAEFNVLGPNEPITEQDMGRIIGFSARERQITDLTGLEYATQLETLSLSFNQISDLSPLSGLTQLVALGMSGNRISDLSPLADLPQLKALWLSFNRISDLNPLSSLTQLETLEIFVNQISDLSPLSGLTRLQSLIIGTNQISDVSPLAGLTQLERLALNNNQISDIQPLAGLTQLASLFLEVNQISDVNPLAELTQLVELWLDRNNISDVSPLASLVNLETLMLAENPITDTSSLANLPNLVEVDIEVTAPGLIPDRNLAAAVREALGLDRNATITERTMRRLISLTASGHRITDLTGLEHATQLERLLLNSNQISNLNPLSELTQLEQLQLWKNQITDVSPLAGLTQLQDLVLADNQIRDVNPLAKLTQLRLLALPNNRIRDVSPLAGLTLLEQLHLQGNQIRDVSPLAGLINLTQLLLVGNPITDTSPLASLTKLTDIDIKITPPTLDGISRLSTPGQIGFSELMFTSRGGPNSLAQWIELYNNSTTETVNLRGWSLTIEARDANRIHRHAVIRLEDLIIPPNQTVLIVTSGGRNSGDFPEDRVYNFFNLHDDALKQDEHPDRVLGAVGFFLMLTDPDGTVSDVVGNLDGDRATEDAPVWELPSGTTEDGDRTSLLRRYDREADAPLDGTKSENWHPASKLELAVMRYWGRDTDIGNPGYRGEGALPVELSSFHAQRTDIGVVIHWTTESEFGNAGFNILRSLTKGGPFVRVNTRLIQGAGTTGERNEYKWIDATAQLNLVYYYQIEDVSFAGDRQVLWTKRLKGIFNAKDKFITRWGDLKKQD